jgi:hypothetical protein
MDPAVREVSSMLDLHKAKTLKRKIVVTGVWVIGFLLGGLGIFLFFFGAPERIESSSPSDSTSKVTIPLIDTEIPAHTETATFALG